MGAAKVEYVHVILDYIKCAAAPRAVRRGTTTMKLVLFLAGLVLGAIVLYWLAGVILMALRFLA